MLHCFFALLVGLLGGVPRVLALLEHKPPVRLPLLPVRTHVLAGPALFRACRLGLLQFVYARPLLAVVTLTL